MNKKYNIIEFKLEKNFDDDGRLILPFVTIFIDGIELAQKIVKYGQEVKGYEKSIIDDVEYIYLKGLWPEILYASLTESVYEEGEYTPKGCVLCCASCGDIYCASIICSIKHKRNSVSFFDFRNYRDETDKYLFPEFCFEKSQYQNEMKKLKFWSENSNNIYLQMTTLIRVTNKNNEDVFLNNLKDENDELIDNIFWYTKDISDIDLNQKRTILRYRTVELELCLKLKDKLGENYNVFYDNSQAIEFPICVKLKVDKSLQFLFPSSDKNKDKNYFLIEKLLSHSEWNDWLENKIDRWKAFCKDTLTEATQETIEEINEEGFIIAKLLNENYGNYFEFEYEALKEK